MKKYITKNFNIITLIFIIIDTVIFCFLNIDKFSKVLLCYISLILFFIFYIIHEECLSEINSKVLDIEYIMRNDFNKELSKEEINNIYKNEYNKYFNMENIEK